MSRPPVLSTSALPNVWQGLHPSIHRGHRDNERWSLGQIAGRLVEVSGHRATATLTAAFSLVLDAQERGEAIAWVTMKASTFYPPDAAEAGVDLDALVVVRLEDVASMGRAAVGLTRSGGFGLVVLDLGPEAIQTPVERTSSKRFRRKKKRLETPLLTKLVGLAQKHDTAVVALTEKPSQTASLSSLVSLRAEARRNPDVPGEVEIAVLKDKRRGPGRLYHEVCRAPAGLR